MAFLIPEGHFLYENILVLSPKKARQIQFHIARRIAKGVRYPHIADKSSGYNNIQFVTIPDRNALSNHPAVSFK